MAYSPRRCPSGKIDRAADRGCYRLRTSDAASRRARAAMRSWRRGQTAAAWRRAVAATARCPRLGGSGGATWPDGWRCTERGRQENSCSWGKSFILEQPTLHELVDERADAVLFARGAAKNFLQLLA